MKMKKAISAVLAATMAMALLAGCGSGSGSDFYSGSESSKIPVCNPGLYGL